MTDFDVCIVGGGLIGLATANAISQAAPDVSVVVLEKEAGIGRHQSGHNSGVVHSGLYYRPGSLKARLCVEGRRALVELCAETGLPMSQSGKVVIASRPAEIAALEELYRRGMANGLEGLEWLDSDQIKEIEPAATGVAALHVPEAGVTDYPRIAGYLASTLMASGGDVVTGGAVDEIAVDDTGVRVGVGTRRYRASILVNCGGLHSDRIARLAGVEPEVRIIPFRGEYFRVIGPAASLVRSMIYPVPDPRFPFLGVHFTRRIDGSVEVGPNAVLALGREHYRGARPDWREVRSVVAYRGFRKLARRHWLSGAKEMINSRSPSLYARLASRLVPGLSRSDLARGGAGVRAQAVDCEGRLVDDFVIQRAGRAIHVLNAPSPGATASLAIGRHIAEISLDALRA